MSNENFQKNFKEQLKKQFKVNFKRPPIGPPYKFQLEYLREHFKEYFSKLEEHFNLTLKKHCMDIYNELLKEQSSLNIFKKHFWGISFYFLAATLYRWSISGTI